MRLIDAHSWLPRSRKKFSGVLDLVSEQQADALEAILAAVDVVAARRRQAGRGAGEGRRSGGGDG